MFNKKYKEKIKEQEKEINELQEKLNKNRFSFIFYEKDGKSNMDVESNFSDSELEEFFDYLCNPSLMATLFYAFICDSKPELKEKYGTRLDNLVLEETKKQIYNLKQRDQQENKDEPLIKVLLNEQNNLGRS